MITDERLIANKFNNFFFFTNIGLNLSKQFKNSRNLTFQNYLDHKYNHNFQFQNVDEEFVTSIISKLAPKTSCGFDGISTKLIKILQDTLGKPITLIINQILFTGIFPDKLKVAEIIPIHKKDDETVFTNYRPILLLLAISKIFEKEIFKQWYSFFQEQKLFYNAQYGFRTEHSTEFASIEPVDRIIVEMNIPISIFLDLSKAFDTLDHGILLSKLKYYGLDGAPRQLMQSYISNFSSFFFLYIHT